MIEQQGMATMVERYIPNDYRKNNYIIAMELLKLVRKKRDANQSWKNLHWSAMHIQNLDRNYLDPDDSANYSLKINPQTREVIDQIVKEKNLKTNVSSLEDWF